MRRMLKHEQLTFSSFMGEAKPHDELSLKAAAQTGLPPTGRPPVKEDS